MKFYKLSLPTSLFTSALLLMVMSYLSIGALKNLYDYKKSVDHSMEQLKNKINNFDLLFQFPFLMRLLYPFIIGCISVFGIWIIFRIRQGKKY